MPPLAVGARFRLSSVISSLIEEAPGAPDAPPEAPPRGALSTANAVTAHVTSPTVSRPLIILSGVSARSLFFSSTSLSRLTLAIPISEDLPDLSTDITAKMISESSTFEEESASSNALRSGVPAPASYVSVHRNEPRPFRRSLTVAVRTLSSGPGISISTLREVTPFCAAFSRRMSVSCTVMVEDAVLEPERAGSKAE